MNIKEVPAVVKKEDPKPGGIIVTGFPPGSIVITLSKEFYVTIPPDKLKKDPEPKVH